MKNKISFFILCLILTLGMKSFSRQHSEKNVLLFSITEATISSIHAAIKSHHMTCEQLVTAYLDQIKKYNLSAKAKPPINAITEINRSVIDEARQLDKIYFQTNKLIGPLHCIPVLLKDNINSLEITTTTGSLSLLGNQPNADAFLVTKLRNAGALILAHAAMDEFAWGLYGISSRTGRTGNVYDTSKNSGGSSAGVASGVSANFATIGIGTDNSGSIRVPAAFNGIMGLRPSMGLISQRGIFPFGNLDGVAGPMARTVEDLVLVLDVIAKRDPKDPKTFNGSPVKTYKIFLNKEGLKQKRIGIVRHVGKIDTFKNMPKNIRAVMQKSFDQFRSLGATVIDEINFPEFNTDRTYNMAGSIQEINDYLTQYPATRKNFSDICNSNRTRTFGSIQECLSFMKALPTDQGDKHAEALRMFEKNKLYVEKLMRENHLDALFIPISTIGIATYDPLAINTWQASLSSNAGLPSIAIIIGYMNSMPVGIELVGEQFNEGKLIEIAYAYEQNFIVRNTPPLPEVSHLLLNLTIPEMNNLITALGKATYDKVLSKGKTGKFERENLTPDLFRSITNDLVQRLKK